MGPEGWPRSVGALANVCRYVVLQPRGGSRLETKARASGAQVPEVVQQAQTDAWGRGGGGTGKVLAEECGRGTHEAGRNPVSGSKDSGRGGSGLPPAHQGSRCGELSLTRSPGRWLCRRATCGAP